MVHKRTTTQLNQPLSKHFSVLTMILSALIVGCKSQEPKAVVAVEPVTCDLTKTLAGEIIDVQCLIKSNQDPHHFKITPQQRQQLTEAKRIFSFGVNLTPAIASWANQKKTTLLAVKTTQERKISGTEAHSSAHGHDDHHAPEDDHGHHGSNDEQQGSSTHDHDEIHGSEDDHGHHHDPLNDPHIWHDPAKTELVIDKISAGLLQIIPTNRTQERKKIEERQASTKQLMIDLDKWNKAQISTIPKNQRLLITRHAGMKKYADKYGLNYMAIYNAANAKSLQPNRLNQTLNALNKNRVPVIFSEQTPASKTMQALSRQSGIPLANNRLIVDGLLPDGTTVSTAVWNTCTIVNGLGGNCDEEFGKELNERWQEISANKD